MEAELSDWLKEKIARGPDRCKAEDLLSSCRPDVEVRVEGGRLSVLRGPEADINEIEEQLTDMYRCSADVDDSGRPVMNGYSSVYQQLPEEDLQQQRQQGSEMAVRSAQQYVHSSWRGPEQGQQGNEMAVRSAQQNVHSSWHGPDISRHGLALPAQDHLTGPDARTPAFTDEMDVDKHVYRYLVFKHGKSLGDISSKYHCHIGLQRGGVDVCDRRQYRLQVHAATQHNLSSAYDELAGMIVKLTEENVIDRKVSLSPKECFAELEAELGKKNVLLCASSCRLIGPAAELNAAQSAVDATVNKMYARKPPLGAAANHVQDTFTFDIPHVALTVHVRQGM